MGCLNDGVDYGHWFGNIHLSGPCNRRCYFCIGQHMMDLDSFDNLTTWPLKGLGKFLDECASHKVTQIFLTGTNTDPSLFRFHDYLTQIINSYFAYDIYVGMRTNGVRWRQLDANNYDEISVSITSFNRAIYRETMGMGEPPDIEKIAKQFKGVLRANIILCPEILPHDLFKTIDMLRDAGVVSVNVREPYGQPHIGNPFKQAPSGQRFGMPMYMFDGIDVTYWDVHYVHVNSVNLYASGRVSLDYPVTKGHSENGLVEGQEKFKFSGRVRDQWLSQKKQEGGIHG